MDQSCLDIACLDTACSCNCITNCLCIVCNEGVMYNGNTKIETAMVDNNGDGGKGMHNIVIIFGSSRVVSTGVDLLHRVEKTVDGNDKFNKYFKYEVVTPIKPLNLINEPLNSVPPLQIKDFSKYDSTIIREYSEIILKSQGFVFILPSYNNSYPGGFKILMDHLFNEFKSKPGVIFTYGTTSPEKCLKEATNLLVNRFGMVIVDTDIKYVKRGEISYQKHGSSVGVGVESVVESLYRYMCSTKH